ncbi:MAG: 4Fe-4S dicluster domain-containing protein [Bacteroidales bacterium]|nr:MAG: 4Fe-4S dicluster domain-containing protein [Bacteroidales bacterium]
MKNTRNRNTKSKNPGFTRRDFLKHTKSMAIGSVMVGTLPGVFCINKTTVAFQASGGYLLVDTKKCQGCLSCMLACSLVHEGKENLSMARIQVLQNSFEGFPDDLTIEQCRQCTEPECVKACPADALHIDTGKSNIRRIDKAKCIGCMSCIEACPHQPGRVVWNFKEVHAQMCDLCSDTPFWDEEGGPGGSQCCVEVCPVAAIKFTEKVPVQKGEKGYKVNLRGNPWRILGYPTK